MNAVECTVYCLTTSPLFLPSSFILMGFAFSSAGYVLVKNSIGKLRLYWLANILALVNAPILYFSMSCSMGLFLKIYFGYAVLAFSLLALAPFGYRYYLKKNYGFERDQELEKLAGMENVFVLNSALPKAFTLGKDVFISAGMLDLLEENELKAVLMHERFHVIQNRTPFLNRLKYLTFLPISQNRIEIMADEYAEKTAGKEALESAKRKIEEFYS